MIDQGAHQSRLRNRGRASAASLAGLIRKRLGPSCLTPRLDHTPSSRYAPLVSLPALGGTRQAGSQAGIISDDSLERPAQHFRYRGSSSADSNAACLAREAATRSGNRREDSSSGGRSGSRGHLRPGHGVVLVGGRQPWRDGAGVQHTPLHEPYFDLPLLAADQLVRSTRHAVSTTHSACMLPAPPMPALPATLCLPPAQGGCLPFHPDVHLTLRNSRRNLPFPVLQRCLTPSVTARARATCSAGTSGVRSFL